MNEEAERFRSALLEAALRAYEDAGIQGLCAEGRWEAAVSAMRSVDLEPLAPQCQQTSTSLPVKPP